MRFTRRGGVVLHGGLFARERLSRRRKDGQFHLGFVSGLLCSFFSFQSVFYFCSDAFSRRFCNQPIVNDDEWRHDRLVITKEGTANEYQLLSLDWALSRLVRDKPEPALARRRAGISPKRSRRCIGPVIPKAEGTCRRASAPVARSTGIAPWLRVGARGRRAAAETSTGATRPVECTTAGFNNIGGTKLSRGFYLSCRPVGLNKTRDNAHGSEALDGRLKAERGIKMVVRSQWHRRSQKQEDRPLRRYRLRWEVDRLFAWLRNLRHPRHAI